MTKFTKLKKRQREFNRLVRKMNETVEQDQLWQGRFQCRQVDRYFQRFDDYSGFSIVWTMEFIDKQSNARGVCHIEWRYGFTFARLADFMNDFIIRATTGDWGHWPMLPWIEINVGEDW